MGESTVIKQPNEKPTEVETRSTWSRTRKLGLRRKSPQIKKLRISAFSKEELRQKTASLLWEMENDPFQVFEVEHDSCLDLEVNVLRGEDITKGYYQDICDTPDPYVVLRIPGSSNLSKRTTCIDNTVNPLWNETFHFYLDPSKTHNLHAILMDGNLLMSDENLGEQIININEVPLDISKDFVLEFPLGSKVHISLKLRKHVNPDLRYSLALCDAEKSFLRGRRINVMNNMQKLLGDRGPKFKEEVPVIAIMGSGGGFRAMVCLSGVIKVLQEEGIIGCATYISGLSGSSWYISTLYAHDKFPFIPHDEIYEIIKKSVTCDWKWHLMRSHRYILAMFKKFKGGQPVSFTDIFGHILGDVLLEGKCDKKLTDQRNIVTKAVVPMPLYTCLHAKAKVSCREFSEWIEFSPYEIGIAKYGTFMKTEHFGSKFIVGKLIHTYPEFPLHYLQGVWGSAFTILIKRLVLEGGTKQDAVQMMREANEERSMHEQLEESYLDENNDEHESSDTDNDEDVEGENDELDSMKSSSNNNPEEELNQLRKSFMKRNEQDTVDHHALSTINEQNVKRKQKLSFGKKGFSFELPKINNKRKKSKDESGARKISTQSDPGISSRKGSLETPGLKQSISFTKDQGVNNFWNSKREERQSKREKKSSIIQDLMTNSTILNSRAGRAGEVLNPFRGLCLKQSFPISPFTQDSNPDESVIRGEELGMGCRYEPLDNNAKKLFVVDSGLAFNSPFPLLLRPQRGVSLYLSFDFSQRASDNAMPFHELILAEKWAKQNKVSFPPVEKMAAEFAKDPTVKELYIFKDKDPLCPVVMHFVIVNNRFRKEKAPGVPRETEEEINFADFSLFDEPGKPYASTNFVYNELRFERLVKLMEFNTLLCIDSIKEEMAEMVEKKRKQALITLEQTFNKMQNVMSACKKFKKNSGNLNLKVNEAQGKTFMNFMKPDESDSDDRSSFYDAVDQLNINEKESPNSINDSL